MQDVCAQGFLSAYFADAVEDTLTFRGLVGIMPRGFYNLVVGSSVAGRGCAIPHGLSGGWFGFDFLINALLQQGDGYETEFIAGGNAVDGLVGRVGRGGGSGAGSA